MHYAVVFVTPVALTLYIVGILALIVAAFILGESHGFRRGIRAHRRLVERLERRRSTRNAREAYQRAFNDETAREAINASDWLPGWDTIGAADKSTANADTRRMKRIR